MRPRHGHGFDTIRESNSPKKDIDAPSVLEKRGPIVLQEKHSSNIRFAVTAFILAVLGVVAAYLQYIVYPSIMSNKFGETQIQLHLSFLTYWYSAKNCVVSASCFNIPGLPAFDFAQLFFILLAAMIVLHFAKYWRMV
jgi:hypothetical protein